MNILEIPMQQNDAGAETIRGYLKALLIELWASGESFSGKRPFGNSGWEYSLYKAMVTAKVVEGEMYEDGCIDWVNKDDANKLIFQAIYSL
jgi:hypothetical protein